jgi:endogenous inhibitor of DNA gyrase (YacG/DUF329 family)
MTIDTIKTGDIIQCPYCGELHAWKETIKESIGTKTDSQGWYISSVGNGLSIQFFVKCPECLKRSPLTKENNMWKDSNGIFIQRKYNSILVHEK